MEIKYIGLIVFSVLLVSGVPISFSMLISGFIGIIACGGLGVGMSILHRVPVSVIGSEGLAVIPLFILMGEIAASGNLHRAAFHAAEKWVGHLRGGLAMATSLACAVFGAACGSTIATTSTLGRLAVDEMRQRNYSPLLAMGSVMASGGLAALIPPSSVMVIYCIVANQSIGKMFIAGFGPGIFFTFVLMSTTYILVLIKPHWAPRIEAVTWKERIHSSGEILPIVILLLLVLLSIYLGIATPSEAAGVGVLGAALIGFFLKELKVSKLWEGAKNSVTISCMILFMMVGGNIMSVYLAYSGLPFQLADYVADLEMSTTAMIFVMIIIYLILGTFLESVGMIMVTVPFFWPTIVALGIDPTWFGIIVVVLCNIACITPPVGYHLFVMAKVVPDASYVDTIKSAIPYAIASVVGLIFIVLFPSMTLWLPSLLGYK